MTTITSGPDELVALDASGAPHVLAVTPEERRRLLRRVYLEDPRVSGFSVSDYGVVHQPSGGNRWRNVDHLPGFFGLFELAVAFLASMRGTG